MHPVPPGISRVHLAQRFICKPKQIANPAPEKSSDMVELHAMLVCTSAMQDEDKAKRAFARADTMSSIRHNEALGSEVLFEKRDEPKAVDGGPVYACPGCITREVKRAARGEGRRSRPHEVNLWEEEPEKRSILFDSPEVIEWHVPGQTQTTNAKNKRTWNENAEPNDITHPDGALQIEIPMRITCYCRHQDERIGFQ